MNRVSASRTIETHNAMRKTALKKAPRISARSHCRNVRCCLEIARARGNYTYAIGVFVSGCFACDLDSPEPDEKGYDIVQHMEGVGHERQGMDKESSGELQQEERHIDGEHGADARRFGPRHLAGGLRRAASTARRLLGFDGTRCRVWSSGGCLKELETVGWRWNLGRRLRRVPYRMEALPASICR